MSGIIPKYGCPGCGRDGIFYEKKPNGCERAWCLSCGWFKEFTPDAKKPPAESEEAEGFFKGP